MTITYHTDLEQGTDEWLAARMGVLTASEVKLILTPTLKIANNEKTRAHVYELLAQRINKYVEPHFIGDDMLRGYDDEVLARAKYEETNDPVTECGFVTNDKFGFTMGYSPDGLVGDDGLIECKSRRQKFQVQTICDDAVPDQYMMQLQTGLLITERKWIDFISYSGGMPMWVKRVYPDPVIQVAIIDAATAFDESIQSRLEAYNDTLAHADTRAYPTERGVQHGDMTDGEYT